MALQRDSKKQSMILTTAAYILALAAAAITFRLLPEQLSLLSKTLAADIAATVVVFIFSLIYNNSSFYDPYWSVIPPLLFSFWAYSTYRGETIPPRVLVILLLTFLWGIRLTLNWAIRWPGLVHEDWRYVSFREKFGRLYWPVSFLGIHFFPTMIVFLCSLPAYMVITLENTPLNYIDVLAGLAGLTAVYFEWKSDLDLYRHGKSENRGKPIATGLWKFSRHPNYFGEILFWFSLYFFALAASPENYKIGIAPVAMMSLFLFYSIPAMEKRQLQRRSEYSDIQKSISMLLPLPPRNKGKELAG